MKIRKQSESLRFLQTRPITEAGCSLSRCNSVSVVPRGDLADKSQVKEKRLHVPLVDRLPEEAPPLVVAVVGPPGVGKTTLIKSLIKRYTKHSLSTPTGPLTVVTSKRRRLTFVECPADSLASMIDVSKIADIVLLMIDGNFGFEMETMEFLNVLSSSGMPGNVFGILTHLDLFRKPQTLKDAKKRLKHRFWSELYQGAKLFYLSGVINGRYPDREVHNISRFISVMKNPRPLIWRNSHPYCLADRFLDVTPPTQIEENPKCDRTIALYGYLRGTNFPAEGAQVHVPGVGDLSVSAVEALPDPCATPFMDQAIAKATGKSGRRRLGEKQKLLFAPMSDVGGVLVDKDAVYIDIKTSDFDIDTVDGKERGLGEQMVVGLQGERRMLGEADDGVRLFSGGDKLRYNGDLPEENGDGRREQRSAKVLDGDEADVGLELQNGAHDSAEVDEDEAGSIEQDIPIEKLGRLYKDERHSAPNATNGDVVFADSDSDIGSVSSEENQEFDEASDFESSDDENAALRWKSNLKENAQKLQSASRSYRAADLARMLYDEALTPAQVARRWRGETASNEEPAEHQDGEAAEDENFFRKAKQDEEDDLEDRAVPKYDYSALAQKWRDPDNLEELRHRFASANLLKEKKAADGGEGSGVSDSSDEGDGEFEDLEGDTNSAPEDPSVTIQREREKNAQRKEELKLRFEEEDRDRSGFGQSNDAANEKNENFGEDDWYGARKAEIQTQLSINRAELSQLDERSRVQVEGYKAGTYARLLLTSVPPEFASTFNPRYPLIVGGLSPTETRFGYVVSTPSASHQPHLHMPTPFPPFPVLHPCTPILDSEKSTTDACHSKFASSATAGTAASSKPTTL